ncbi:hypothetical protein HUT16_23665 [Kitasatospora sp. NA04385]|uniref:hypothetical protein n=1 Tax=Kitasatospora sp. NA04385 TaxID=2742135 RepID=UPI0015922E62|nr:hypothetical protein [Kitasatospora sp. NA04385]QKW21657.1 hypothetical protein HUT16_23665 [Kitasatospora sp. NA04385]
MGANASVLGHADDLFIEDLGQSAAAAAGPVTGTLCFCRAADAYLAAPAETTTGRRA